MSTPGGFGYKEDDPTSLGFGLVSSPKIAESHLGCNDEGGQRDHQTWMTRGDREITRHGLTRLHIEWECMQVYVWECVHANV